ncbi:tripartite tricarboxylate transporter TctB family protein [Bosea sp. BK604]|uniref:tripartite tricarboxylate transporter TctB family protein n=1 Tax=Bosea sp. BK604 TaxID=2512180 RepID=UPI0010EE1C32|nr:tripartite tricarboxylate transporter TctB family protein [Bosea sp. BK604]TCR62539.1 tripartite tricarboxylate transporter TctB family protein [Bosea sp. BK604]
MLRMSLDRVTFLVALILGLAFFWQARTLDMWDLFGPGPGLFPMLTTAFCCVLAAILFAFPGLATEEAKAEPEQELGPTEKRNFWAYALALPFLVLASAWLGFILMSVVLVLALCWGAEGRSWKGALVYGILLGLLGVLGFNYLLETQVPLGPLDEFVLRLATR